MVKVKVISKETIKPSSPTPPHLFHHKLSFTDQIAPPEYMTLVLFYPARTKDAVGAYDMSNHLKTSLSKTLTHFYPLAGRLKENLGVECNDKGAAYLETRVACCLSDVLESICPVDLELYKFLPFVVNDHQSTLLGVQFNVFACGGVILSICLSHKVADGSSMVFFVKTWAEICRGGEKNITLPEFVADKHFPPKDSYNNIAIGMKPPFPGKNVVTKRFVFGPLAIEALRTKYEAASAGLHIPRQPSRIEALEAFIWSRYVKSTHRTYPGHNGRGGSYYVVSQPVNLRTKLNPPLPAHSFGNLVGSAAALIPKDGTGDITSHEKDLQRFRMAVQVVGEESMETQHRLFRHYLTMATKGETDFFGFISLCGLAINEFDFGRGKPAMVGVPARSFENTVLLLDTNSGDGGVEAYVGLKKETMSKFEVDEELRTYVLYDTKNCRL